VQEAEDKRNEVCVQVESVGALSRSDNLYASFAILLLYK
jgi:hypothetical protein